MLAGSRFDGHSRVRLLGGATPIQRLRRVEAAMGAALHGARLFAKRDDATPLGGGGSKLRKLEFLLGEAIEAGADTIIAAGTRQSNATRLAAAAAASIGLHCELGLYPLSASDDADYHGNGNALLHPLFGARVHDLPDAASIGTFISEREAALAVDGRIAYVIPSGASSPGGSLGYANCAFEIADQERALGLRFDRVVVANGSSGTHAGLVAGFAVLGRARIVQGVSVRDDAQSASLSTLDMARAALALMGDDTVVHADDVVVTDAHRGDGYGIPTRESLTALRLVAENEGLLLDPVYSAKAFAAILCEASLGRFVSGQNILFVMTGGVPTLFAYRNALAALNDA